MESKITGRSFFYKSRIIYFFVCFILIVWLGGTRSAPVHGKLDFLMLDSRPWWPEWQPMVESILKQGKQPVYSDPITSTVLNGVFGQETVLFREFGKLQVVSPILYVEKMGLLNRPEIKMFPAGSLSLLFKGAAKNIFTEFVNKHGEANGDKVSETVLKTFPYRCVVNVHGFSPTWVSYETGHWNPRLADTKWFYRYHYTHVAEIIAELKEHPPENCEVFF